MSSCVVPISVPDELTRMRFMKEGFDQDDMWVMVEDEFLETAQQFTRHLHHAEYQRLKRLAEENKAAGQDDIVRPVDGKSVLSVAGQKRAESERLRRKQRKALREVVADKQDGEHWEDDAWASNPRLAGLMARSVPTNLAKLVDSQSQTQISESQPTEKPPRVEECLSSPPPDLGSSPPPVIRKSKSVLSSRCPTTDFAPPKANSRLKSAGRQNQTGSGRQKQEEEKRRSVKLDEIPTFLV